MIKVKRNSLKKGKLSKFFLVLLFFGCSNEIITTEKGIVCTIIGWNIKHHSPYNSQYMDYISINVMINNGTNDTLFVSHTNDVDYLYTYFNINSHFDESPYTKVFISDKIHFTLNLMKDYQISPYQEKVIKMKVKINNLLGCSLANYYDCYGGYFENDYKILTKGIISNKEITIEKDSSYTINFFLDEGTVSENSDLLFFTTNPPTYDDLEE